MLWAAAGGGSGALIAWKELINCAGLSISSISVTPTYRAKGTHCIPVALKVCIHAVDIAQT